MIVSCSIGPVMSNSFGRSMPIRLNCRASCGPWSRPRPAAQPTPVVALANSGMNDVLNSQGYTQASWWDRIPLAAWGLLAVIAICCNLMVGYGARHPEAEGILMLILPTMVSVSFLLIADIDSPRGGVVLVQPRNLLSLAQSLQAQ